MKSHPVPGGEFTPAFLPLLLLLFVGSGCAALIYEVVWFQILGLIVGSSAISIGVLLGTFMGGMCIGSFMLSRVIKRSEHPLRVYALLEASIAVSGLLLLLILPLIGTVYVAIAGQGFTGLFFRAIVAAICLLPPTVMMGATLPAISRWVETSPEGVSWLGFFYGGNIGGAVFGSLLAGFYLLRVYDVITATFVAVAINVAVAVAALVLAKTTPYRAPLDDSTEAPAKLWSIPKGSWPVYVAIALSGMSALGAEIIWTRLLSLSLGASVYTFSLIIAAILIGLGIGSSVGAMIARETKHARRALGICQLLLMFGLAWAGIQLMRSLPYWPINPSLSSSPWFQFQIDIVRCLWTVLPAAVLWGASFPLALAAVAARNQDPGRLVGTVYAANTIGGILGAMIASLVLIPWIGTQQSMRVLIGLAAIAAVLTLSLVPAAGARILRLTARSAAGGVLALVIGFVLAATVAPIPALLVGYGHNAANRFNNHGDFIYVGEGMNSSMAVSRLSNGVLNYHNAGKVQASSEPQDMRLQRMLGHFATLVPDHARTVLVIGCGAGVTAGAVSISPALDQETIAEIEPLVPEHVARIFGAYNYHVIDNPKVRVQIDDARHFILTTKEKFDAVTSDPFDPWVKGAANLYTVEFFNLVKEHLNPGGVVTVFVQLYESNVEAVKSEVATFLEAFPNGMVFGNTNNGGGYDVVLLGRVENTPLDIDAIEARLQRPEYAVVRQSLAEIGFHSATELFATFAATGAQLAPWIADAQINRDKNLRLQYLAGMGLNLYLQDPIYREMIQYRRFPEGLFKASPDKMQLLRDAIRNP